MKTKKITGSSWILSHDNFYYMGSFQMQFFAEDT
jgi:hypothetical protein